MSEETKKSWCDTGYEGLDAAKAEYEKRMPQDGELDRFYLKEGAEATIVFETDTPLCFWEHQFHLNGHWRNWFRCRKSLDTDGCDLCEDTDNNPSYVGVFVIRNLTGFKTRKGETAGVGRRQLLVAKTTVMETIKKLRDTRVKKDLDRGVTNPRGLIREEFVVSRTGDKSPNTGNVFDSQGEYDMSTLPDAGEMPDLMELLMPQSNKQHMEAIGGGGSDDSSSDAVKY